MIHDGEAILRSLGFRHSRIRHHGDIARIEIARDELPEALDLDMRDRMAEGLKALGFRYVTVDLEGYTTEGLNESPGDAKGRRP